MNESGLNSKEDSMNFSDVFVGQFLEVVSDYNTKDAFNVGDIVVVLDLTFFYSCRTRRVSDGRERYMRYCELEETLRSVAYTVLIENQKEQDEHKEHSRRMETVPK